MEKQPGFVRALVELLMLFSTELPPDLIVASPTPGSSERSWDVLLHGHSNGLRLILLLAVGGVLNDLLQAHR